MANRHTVTINGREFEVKDRQSPGGMKRAARIVDAAAALSEAKAADSFKAMAVLVAAYLDSDDPAWLFDNLPADVNEIIRECIVASGGEVAKPGEGKSQ